MRAKRVGQTALTAFLFAACMMLFMASYAAIAPAQNLSSSLTLPQQPEVPVSPSTPGTLPGTTAGPDTAVGTNPVTGTPCIGGVPGAPIIADQPSQPGQGVNGLPPNNSVYGLSNQFSASKPGAC